MRFSLCFLLLLPMATPGTHEDFDRLGTKRDGLISASEAEAVERASRPKK